MSTFLSNLGGHQQTQGGQVHGEGEENNNELGVLGEGIGIVPELCQTAIPKEGLAYTTEELLKTMGCMKIPGNMAYRVLEMQSPHPTWKADSPLTGCTARFPSKRPANATQLEIRDAAEKHILGKHAGESWLISLTVKKVWALFHAIKSIVQRNKPKAIIAGVDLSKLTEDLVINCATKLKATEVGIASWVAKAWSASAGEALVPEIQPDAISKDHIYVIDPNTTIGERLLEVEGKDRERDNSGLITKYGCFCEWKKAFEAAFPLPGDRDWVFRKIRIEVQSVSSSGRTIRAPHP